MTASTPNMRILHLDSSPTLSHSASRALSRAIVESFGVEADVQYRDLGQDPIAHLTAETFATLNPESERILAQFLWADVVVIGAPMVNFSIPSTLKAWIDRVAVAGKTFRYTENGPEGLVGDKRVIVASTRGGVYGEDHAGDFQEAYLKQLFGFLGIKQVRFVRAEGLAYSPQHKQEAVEAAQREIEQAGLTGFAHPVDRV